MRVEVYTLCWAPYLWTQCILPLASSSLALAARSRDGAGVVWWKRRFRDLIGIVVSGVVEVVADGRGQHDEQVDAVHLIPQVRQPDQTVHLRNGITRVSICVLLHSKPVSFVICLTVQKVISTIYRLQSTLYTIYLKKNKYIVSVFRVRIYFYFAFVIWI